MRVQAGQLRDRVDVFTYSSTSSTGDPASRYTRSPRGRSWWSRKRPASANEQLIAGQMQQTIDAVFVFRIAAIDALTPDGKIRHGSRWYSITGIREQVLDDSPDRGAITVTTVEADDEPTPGDVVE